MASIVINPQTFDFTNIEIGLPGLGTTPITELSYSDTIDYGELRQNKGYVEDTTSGQYSASASLTVTKSIHAAFLKALSAAAPGGRIQDFEFPITSNYAKNPTDPVITDELLGVKYAGGESGGSSGTDALLVPITLHVRYIKWDGISLLGDAAPF